MAGNERDVPSRELGGRGETPGADEGSPTPARGSAEPSGGGEPTREPGLDEGTLSEGGGAVPFVDALDAGDPGAPVETLDTGSGHGPGAGARHEGGAGGSGAVVGDIRQHAHDMTHDQGAAPASGGPPGELPDEEAENRS